MKLCAVCLVVLAGLPFTAPFASLDAADFFGGERTRTSATVIAALTSASAQDDDADDAAVSDAIIQRVHASTLTSLTPVTSALVAALEPSPETAIAQTISRFVPHGTPARPSVLRL